MATISAALSTTSTFSEINFLSPNNCSRRIRFWLPTRLNVEKKYGVILRNTRIVAAKRDELTVLVDEKENEYVTQLNGSANGSSNGSYGINGSVVEEYAEGSVGVVESESEEVNGSLVKYVNGNGNGGMMKSSDEAVEVKVEEKNVKKKSIEEIGQEEAWFKQSGGDQVEVRLTISLWGCFNAFFFCLGMIGFQSYVKIMIMQLIARFGIPEEYKHDLRTHF